MATLDIKPAAGEPQLNLLMPKGSLDQPLWKSLFQNLDDFFFPKKQPPLVLTSKPVPVKDIWGFYDYKKSGALGSTLAHVVVIGAIIGITIVGRRVVTEITKPHETVTLLAPEDIPVLQPAKTISGGGGGVFRVGGGVSAPKELYAPEPEYSEEARKAKYQGTCVLYLIVGPDGKPRDIRVARSLGLGLDEKAIEAVKQWKFEPAMKDGKPVAVAINVEVDFRLY